MTLHSNRIKFTSMVAGALLVCGAAPVVPSSADDVPTTCVDKCRAQYLLLERLDPTTDPEQVRIAFGDPTRVELGSRYQITEYVGEDVSLYFIRGREKHELVATGIIANNGHLNHARVPYLGLGTGSSLGDIPFESRAIKADVDAKFLYFWTSNYFGNPGQHLYYAFLFDESDFPATCGALDPGEIDLAELAECKDAQSVHPRGAIVDDKDSSINPNDAGRILTQFLYWHELN